MNIDWQKTKISADESHHVLNEKPFYTKRFTKVLKYHKPGLAPVVDASGAYHIDIKGDPLYFERYLQTFGYYDGLSSIESLVGWFHIDTQGKRLYKKSYAWCGNFQESFCAVKDKETHCYYHINKTGVRAYPSDYCYVGDYRDGIAVVCMDNGLQTHVYTNGDYLHNRWFIGLDVFHKNIARAEDKQGWFHIDKLGNALYLQRYKAIEPFYNNVAVVETFDGSLLTINTAGEQLHIIRQSNQSSLQELSADLIGFWKTQTIHAAVKIKIFDYLPNTSSGLALAINLKKNICERLLRALQELNLVDKAKDCWYLTLRGTLLTPCSSSPMAAAAQVWGSSHYQAWTKLETLLQAPPVNTHNYFESLTSDKSELALYQQALSGYAVHDYQNCINVIDWSLHQVVIDAGGGVGTLLHFLLQHYPHLQGILLEKPNVISLISEYIRNPRCLYSSIDLREPWPHQADAIIFARVLHDWPDEDAVYLLRRARDSLLPGGKVYLLEMVLTPEHTHGGLLDLNMLVMTGGRERTLSDWQKLCVKARLILVQHTSISPIVSLLELTIHG